MKYVINLRMKNPGPAKYLIRTDETDDDNSAFYIAQEMAMESDRDHFVEIVSGETNEQLAVFNGG